MRTSTLASVIMVGVLLALPTLASAQYAEALTGRVVDATGAVLPGVTITATHEEAGNIFTAVTDAAGTYRIPLPRIGIYRVSAELPGFTTVTRRAEVLVGQQVTLNLELALSGVQESVTVTSEAPLVDTQTARVAGNVDQRQMELLPINGRNWMELATLVKGVTQNVITEAPAVQQTYQMNLDSQQVTQDCCGLGFGQPKLSREAIAEYQVVTSNWDITQGRATVLQVNAVSKAGTNRVSGSAFGNFRDDALNAKDFIANRVLPYSNQQFGATLGGPIIQDKLHYFGVYEYEREPQTLVLAPPALGGQTMTLPDKAVTRTMLVRGDYQISQRDQLMARYTWFKKTQLNRALTGSSLPSDAANVELAEPMLNGSWSRVISNNLLQELRVGSQVYNWVYKLPVGMPPTPRYQFPGLGLGAIAIYPQDVFVGTPLSTRYDVTWNNGRHALKTGGEFLYMRDWKDFRPSRRGTMFFSRLPADAARRFPLDAWNDPSRWDFTGLDDTIQRFDINLMKNPDFLMDTRHKHYAAWLGDTWTVGNTLTLNLGLRYDVPWNALAMQLVEEYDIIIDNGKFVENAGFDTDIRDLSNIAPRGGFAWDASGGRSSLVIRGGSGLFYGTIGTAPVNVGQVGENAFALSYIYDGRPGFLQDPLRGATAEDYLAGRLPLPPQRPAPISPDKKIPFVWQNMLGFQKQLGDVLAFDADLVYRRGYHEQTNRDPNLFYDPATGYPRNPNRFGRPNPAYGPIALRESLGRSEYLAVPMSLTRRYRDNLQVGATYTLMLFKRDNGGSANPFDLVEGGHESWARANDFQRHTVRVNGVYQLPWDFQVSGLMRYGSGNYSQIQSPADPTGSGGGRVRADLTTIPRNTFEDDPFFTTDVRVAKVVRVGTVRLEGMAEVFNAFNYARYEYNRLEGSALFGRRTTAAPPRTGQLAFRVTF